MRPIQTVTKSSYDRNWRLVQDEMVTAAELRRIRDYVQKHNALTGMARINPSLTKQQAFDILFRSAHNKQDDELMHPIIFKNVLREFILNRKKITDEWRTMAIINEEQS